jgi:predicted TIM-barrel fold metal-dependent hydrolase
MSSPTPSTTRILANANRDSIKLSTLPFLSPALASIADLSTAPIPPNALPDFTKATRIDTHTHPIPDWFRTLQPLAAGRETPSWDPLSHLEFMASHDIAHSILCISTPQANAFPDDVEKTVALARLLNEFCAELVRVYPQRFSWMCVTPLPYVEEAVREVRYAIEELGAVGVGVMTNHEGFYPGEERFDALWAYLQRRAGEGGGKEVVFIHPTDPVIRLDDGRLVGSKPCKCMSSDALSIGWTWRLTR